MIKTSYVSTASIAHSALSSLQKLQLQLVKAQTEVTTGRYADIGEALGYRAASATSLRQEQNRLSSIMDANGLVKSRLDGAQAGLQAITSGAEEFLESLTSATNSDLGPALLQTQARNALTSFIATANSSFNGAYIFSGINSDTKPFEDYFASPAPQSQQAVINAFTTYFGFPPTDPQVSTIDASSMQGFLDNEFSDLFADPAWKSDWSSASDKNVRSRIASSELIETSANANEAAFRKLASAYVMIADLGTANLAEGTYKAVVDQASKLISEGIGNLTQIQGRLGDVQARVSGANERMELQINILKTSLGGLEDVDATELSTKIAQLTTQIETAYALTARLQNLSLLNYL